MKLIVGLGNPGRGYANNRHNVGFTCLNHFARTQGIRFDKKQGRARIGIGEVAGSKVVLAKPQTYMNLSGQSVGLLINKFDISLDDLIIIHDDLDLPLGKIRIRQGGSSGGDEFSEADIIDYVLSDFTPGEKQAIAGVIPRVSEAIVCLLTEGLTAAMNKYN